MIGALAFALLGTKLAYDEDTASSICAGTAGDPCPASVKNYVRNISIGVVVGGFFGYIIGTNSD